MTKTEIEADLAKEGDFVKIDHLNRFLKEGLPLETKKFSYQKLSEIYEKRGMYNDAAKISENIALTNAENYTKSITSNYQSLLDEYKKYFSSVDYYEKQAVPEANLIIEQATRSYKAGALDYLDYVLTLNRALAIRQNYLDALNNLNQTIIAIEYITGKIF